MVLGVGWFGATLPDFRPGLYARNEQLVANVETISIETNGRMYGTFSYTPDQSGAVFAELDGFQGSTGS